MKLKLLEYLEHNAKASIDDISGYLNISINETISLISELENTNVICGYNCIINWDKITNEKCNALIEVKVVPQSETGFDRIANRISKFSEVDSIYLMSGSFDFIVAVNGKSMKEVSSFVFNKLATIDYLQSTSTHFVLKKYKDHGVFFSENNKTKRTNIIL